MKTLFSVLAAAAVLGFAAPSTAKADHFCNGQTRVVGYNSCGTPIVAQYRIVGYDHCGRPIGQWVTLPPQQPNYGYNPGYGHGHHQHGYSGYRPSYSRPRSGISFNFGFGR
ncbi:hypothetical protein [Prosthecobacter sp.]|uniref:hypothetical protein n=1 Tax=Prosthecobacter sp. TaxID=1965333 RepID=UPI002ABABA91|nr:hypothetical protein [Prosthecobacter sp.]MDZ4406196.1 hypothetical protein [Prosthecobacter sp.]